jgi:hypothetical protein
MDKASGDQMQAHPVHWAPLFGEAVFKENGLTFKGTVIDFQGQSQPSLGNFISNITFGGGKIRADIEFESVDEFTGCEIILYYDPANRFFVTAGLGGTGLYAIRHFHPQNLWFVHAVAGDHKNLQAKHCYNVEVTVNGSRVLLKVDGVEVLSALLPYQTQVSQIGIWCMSKFEIYVSNFAAVSEPFKAFVVMQFSTPYNELYEDVISPVCENAKIKAIRSDEIYGPEIILADIMKQINESKLVIAEITAKNPNVFYEIGYAQAIHKPIILIAEQGTTPPFDVSPFRILFYENSIAGKKRVEEGLKKHLEAILAT